MIKYFKKSRKKFLIIKKLHIGEISYKSQTYPQISKFQKTNVQGFRNWTQNSATKFQETWEYVHKICS